MVCLLLPLFVKQFEAEAAMSLPKLLVFSKKADDGDQLQQIIGKHRYRFTWTDNGPEAIIQALSGGLDAVIIFIQSRGHRELEYIPCINSIDHGLPVIVISDHDTLKLQREIRKHKVFYYLPRPVEKEEIRAVLGDAVAAAVKRR